MANFSWRPALATVSLLLTLLQTAAAASDVPQTVRSGKIVAVLTPGASHWYQFKPIIEELVQRGHHVKVITTRDALDAYMPSIAGLANVTTDVVNSSVTEFQLRKRIKAANRVTGLEGVKSSFGLPEHTHALLQDLELHTRIQVYQPDLILADFVFMGAAALADKLSIPKALVVIPGLLSPQVTLDYGSGSHLLATVPQFQSLLPRKMNFLQRLQNLVGFVMNMLVWTQVIQKHATEQFWVKYKIPPYSLLQSNREACLVLFPTDWALTNPQPIAPHMHVIGSITAKAAKPLPSELEAFVQSAGEHGVVFASLGTTAIPDEEEVKQLAAGLSALAPTKVIWKLSDKDLLHVANDSYIVADNVKIVRWAPQNDVLGHPNVKAFLTQGGTNSFNEAGYHGVPVVGMPLFAEQPDNIAFAEDHGFGLPVSVRSKSLAKDVTNALHRVLREPSFAVSAARISTSMQARSSTPAEVAASAIEHAIWTKGSAHLQPWRRDLTWFQMMSIDVILTACGLLVLLTAALSSLLFLSVRYVFRFVARRGDRVNIVAKKKL